MEGKQGHAKDRQSFGHAKLRLLVDVVFLSWMVLLLRKGNPGAVARGFMAAENFVRRCFPEQQVNMEEMNER